MSMPRTVARSVSNIEPGAVICAVASAIESMASLIERSSHRCLGEQRVAVVLELSDRLADVVERPMGRRLVGEIRQYLRVPTARQLLQGRDVDVAVVEELFERRHVLLEEPAIGTDGVAAEWNRARFGDVLLQKGQCQVL